MKAEDLPPLSALRPGIFALGPDVVELFGPKTVTYRVYDFFVEVIPRKRRLLLNINLDYDECDDPSQQAKDTSDRAFIVNAEEQGGVTLSLREPGQIASALHVLRQAYDQVSS